MSGNPDKLKRHHHSSSSSRRRRSNCSDDEYVEPISYSGPSSSSSYIGSGSGCYPSCRPACPIPGPPGPAGTPGTPGVPGVPGTGGLSSGVFQFANGTTVTIQLSSSPTSNTETVGIIGGSASTALALTSATTLTLTQASGNLSYIAPRNLTISGLNVQAWFPAQGTSLNNTAFTSITAYLFTTASSTPSQLFTQVAASAVSLTPLPTITGGAIAAASFASGAAAYSPALTLVANQRYILVLQLIGNSTTADSIAVQVSASLLYS